MRHMIQQLLASMEATDARAQLLVQLLEQTQEESESTTPVREGDEDTIAYDLKHREDVGRRMDTEETEVPEPVLLGPEERYEGRGILGRGGMGEVRMVYDQNLGRNVAMKVLRSDRLGQPGYEARLLREARATSQLEHPGIVPIYDIGVDDRSQTYFTTRVVNGTTLSERLTEVHQASVDGQWTPAPSGWNFRRLVQVLHTVCETMAYAHSTGVIHRDLKPDNVMLGNFGEVFIMDWGLVKRTADLPDTATNRVVQLLQAQVSQSGVISGTPTYMPPEQARGDNDLLGPHTDVYALGAILYKILTGRPPYSGGNKLSVLRQVDVGPPPHPAEIATCPLPPDLIRICLKAMAREPGERYPSAAEMAADLGEWLEGAREREHAQQLLLKAIQARKSALELDAEANRVMREARRMATFVDPFDETGDKQEVWDLEDRALELQEQALGVWHECVEGLNTALRHHRDLPEARQMLADRYRDLHEAAERDGNRGEAVRLERMIRRFDLGRHEAYLRGTGRLNISFDLGALPVHLHRVHVRRRHLEQELVETFTGPDIACDLPMGSYVLTAEPENHQPLTYPFSIRRGECWTGHPPSIEASMPLALPLKTDLTSAECWVPEGPFWLGGDREAIESQALQRHWLPSFIMRRDPVTNAEFLQFLNHLVDEGREAEALAHVPKELPRPGVQHAPLVWTRTRSGRFLLPTDQPLWGPQHPVVMVSWHAANAFAAWTSEQTGLPWRIPTEWEWEKAARGADRRAFPCGDFLDTSWACTRGSHQHQPSTVQVDAFPRDVSVYGVRGLAGNVSDWCADAFRQHSVDRDETQVRHPPSEARTRRAVMDERVVRGGHWRGSRRRSRCASRSGQEAANPSAVIGFRLVRTWNAKR